MPIKGDQHWHNKRQHRYKDIMNAIHTALLATIAISQVMLVIIFGTYYGYKYRYYHNQEKWRKQQEINDWRAGIPHSTYYPERTDLEPDKAEEEPFHDEEEEEDNGEIGVGFYGPDFDEKIRRRMIKAGKQRMIDDNGEPLTPFEMCRMAEEGTWTGYAIKPPKGVDEVPSPPQSTTGEWI